MPPQPKSTIYVDDREVERQHVSRSTGQTRTVGTDILTLLQSHRSAPRVERKRLIAGDFCFAGEGPKGPSLVGIERKRTKDMLSSIRSGRFSGEQLPKLLDQYEFIFLVLEGRYRTNWRTGIMEEKWGKEWSSIKVGEQQNFLTLELESFLNTISICTPVKVRRTHDERETVEYVLALHHSFSKPWDKHHAHVAIHQPGQYATVGKASTVRRVAFTLSGVGWERSGAVEQRFRSVEEMVEAEPGDWAKLDGFGKILSNRVYRELRGEYEPEGLE